MRGSLEVVIPTKDAPPDRLARAVASARAIAARVIVVDDGSATPVEPFDSESAAASIAKVEIVRRRRAGGPSVARNAGLAVSRAEWVVFLDDDDELLADGVRAAVTLGERLDAAAVVSARIEVGDEGERRREPPSEWADAALPAPGLVFTPIGLFGASGLLARGDPARERGFDEGLWIGEDRDLLRGLGATGPIGVNASCALRVTLRGDGNLTSPAHLERRVEDHVALLERWWGEDSADGFREGTRWLLSACAKHGVSDHAWAALVEAAKPLGIPVPVKARLRRAWIGARS